jgi:hypothetical protein
LCAGQILPRRGRVEVEALAPLGAETGAGDLATELRDAARVRIGAALDEPVV